MSNEYVERRLEGVLEILRGQARAASAMSTSTRGAEREAFVDHFLKHVFPSPFRFGSGDATDAGGRRSGQLDVVVEYPFSPTLPVPGAADSRLYLAESVAAVVEVKSDVASQWNEVTSTARQLNPLRRTFGAMMIMGSASPTGRIPLFAVGYKGWKTLETLESHLEDKVVDGILVIDPPLFVSSRPIGMAATGAWALWGLIACLHRCMGDLRAAATDPLAYATD